MSEIQSLSSVISESLLLKNSSKESSSEKLRRIQEQLDDFPSVLDESTLTKLKNGEYEISLKEYTSMSSYNTMMTALYGDNSANPLNNVLNFTSDSAEQNLASAKSFVNRMKELGMSNSQALRRYTALQKYSLMSSYKNYNFIKTIV